MTLITKDQKRIIRNHANRNVTHLLDKLGVPYYDRGDGLIQACCPCQQHGGDGDNETAFSWRLDLGKWVCWSHHCEQDRGNDIFGLVSCILGGDFMVTLNWIIETLEERQVDLDEEVADPENLHRGVKLHIHNCLDIINSFRYSVR